MLWDKVVSIEPDGKAETFDTRVNDLHNFVVGGIFAHNSGAIEQDADQAAPHRPEYYDPNDQPGLAEAIIAKNRNGPTRTVKLGVQQAQRPLREPPRRDPPGRRRSGDLNPDSTTSENPWEPDHDLEDDATHTKWPSWPPAPGRGDRAYAGGQRPGERAEGQPTVR